MKFEETGICIDVTNIPLTFIYFLLKNDEVVYVGKTTKGITRAYSHIHTDKDFDKIFMLPCDEDKLNEFENTYILKYRPIYNKILNLEDAYSITRVLKKINMLYTYTYTEDNTYVEYGKKCTKRKLSRIFKELGIVPIEFNNFLYIRHNDLIIIENAIEDYLMGGNGNEVFNIWV